MSSYFVEGRECANGEHAVHDRSRCPPSCFAPEHRPQYLGEFLDAAQAVTVARVRYRHAHGCACCGGDEAAAQHWVAMPLAAAWFALRS